MVTVIDFQKRTSLEGKEFNVLILNGGMEFVKSNATGAYYATAKKAGLPCTFTDEVCKTMIGQQIPGIIEKVEVDEYEYTNPETGEILTLHHRNRYNPNPNTATTEETVFTGYNIQEA